MSAALPRPGIMAENSLSIDSANAPRASAAPVNAFKCNDLFTDFVGSSTLPPLRSACPTATTVCAAPCPTTRRLSSDVNALGSVVPKVVAQSANIRGASFCEDGGNASSSNRRNGAFEGNAAAQLLTSKAATSTPTPRPELPPRASGRASPVPMTVAAVARQCREMVMEMLEKSAAASAATQDSAAGGAPSADGAAAGETGDAGESAAAAAATVVLPLDTAAMSGSVFDALRSAAGTARVTHADRSPRESTYQPLPRCVFDQSLRKAQELSEPKAGLRRQLAKFSGCALDSALTAASAGAAGAVTSVEDLMTPQRAPAILLTPLTTPPAARASAGATAGTVSRRPTLFTSALPTFQLQVQAAAHLDHRGDPCELQTPLQVKAYDLCRAEMAARKVLWTAFLADRYELFVVEMGIASTYDPVSATLVQKPGFGVVLSLMSTMVQRYLDMSLEESLVWIGDAYLSVYKPQPTRRQLVATPSPPSTGPPQVPAQRTAPSPIAARSFKSVLSPPSPCPALPPATGVPVRAVTALPPAAPLPLIGPGHRTPLSGVKDPLPTFRSFVKRHPRGLPCLEALNHVPVFTASFMLRVSLKVLDEFAALRHMTVPPVVAAAVQMLLPVGVRSASLFSDSFASCTATADETALLPSGSTKTEACVALGTQGGRLPDGSAALSSTELVLPHRSVDSPQSAFWRLLRRWNTTPTQAAHRSRSAAVGAAARPVGTSEVTPYAAALVALRQIFRFYHSEAAFSAATDSPISISHFYPLPGIAFERVAAMVRTVMLCSEFFASVGAAAESHFGFHTRLRHYRSVADRVGAVGPHHQQRILQQCAQEAINLSAAVHEVWCQARLWWLSYVQSTFRATAPVRHAVPCVLSGVNITGLHLSGVRGLPVEPRRLSGNANASTPQPSHQQQQHQDLPAQWRRLRSPCLSSSVRQWPASAEERLSSVPPFVNIIASPLTSPLESLIAVVADGAGGCVVGERGRVRGGGEGAGDGAAGGSSRPVPRSPMRNMAPSCFGHELSCGSPPSVTSSENFSVDFAVPSELREPAEARVPILVPSPAAVRLVGTVSRGPTAFSNPLGTLTSPSATRSHSHDSAHASRHTEAGEPQTRRITNAFLTTVPQTPLTAPLPNRAAPTPPSVRDGPSRTSCRLAVPPLRSLLCSHFTGAAAEWDLVMLLRREAYERAVVATQAARERLLLQGWASDGALAVQTARHLGCVVASLHDVWLVFRRRDLSRHFWDQVCMEKQMLVNRWVKQRTDMQFQFFAEAVYRSEAELQLEGLACIADEFKTLAHMACRQQHARRPTQSPRRISDYSASALPLPLSDLNGLDAELAPSAQRSGVVSVLLPSSSENTAATLPCVLPVPPPDSATPAAEWQQRPYELWGYGGALPPADSPVGLRDGVVIMSRLCRDLQLGGRRQCTNWFRTDDADDSLQRFRGDFHELCYANRDIYVGYTRLRPPEEPGSCRADAFEDAQTPNRNRNSLTDVHMDDRLDAGELLRHGPGHYTAVAAGYTYVGGWSNDRPHGDGALLLKGALPWETGTEVSQTSTRLVFGQWQCGQLKRVEVQFSGDVSPQ